MSLTIRCGALLVALGLATQMSGCANEPIAAPDARFGDSVRAARQAQTLNPKAPDTSVKAPGVDAKAAVNAVDQYHESFKTPPQTFNVLNINTSSTGQ